MRGVGDEAHEAVRKPQGVFTEVGDAEEDAGFGESHDAEADFAIGLGDVGDGFDRVAVDGDDVVEEAHGIGDGGGEGGPVDVRAGEEGGQVEGTEVAGFVGEQGDFAAGIGGFEEAGGGGGIGAVDGVEEDEAGVAGGPGGVADFLKQGRGGDGAHGVAVAGMAEREGRVRFDGGHEFIGGADGEVEVLQGRAVALGVDEGFDVGVVDAEDAHVGAAPAAALLDVFGGAVEDLHERDGAGGGAAGGGDDVTFRAEAGEGEASAAAGTLDEGHVAEGAEDGLHAVFDGKDEAGRQLAERGAGVHERGGVGEEAEGGEEGEEALGPFFRFGWGRPVEFGLGDGAGDSFEELGRGFGGAAVVVAAEVPGLKNAERVGSEGHRFYCGPGGRVRGGVGGLRGLVGASGFEPPTSWSRTNIYQQLTDIVY